MVLIATTPAGHSLAFAVEDRPTAEELRRLAAVQSQRRMSYESGRSFGSELADAVIATAAGVAADLGKQVRETTGDDRLTVSFDMSPLVKPAGGTDTGSPPPEPVVDPPPPAGQAEPEGGAETVELQEDQRVPAPKPGRKRHFNASQKGAIIHRVVREGIAAVADDTQIHESTLHRWMREMPQTVKAAEEKLASEVREDPVEAEGHPPIGELAAERNRPVPPKVVWPNGPMEKRTFDPDRVRSDSVERGV